MGKFILLAIMLYVVGATMFHAVGMYKEADRERKGAEVLAVCNSSRMRVDRHAEASCGQLQDHYGFEFLCEANDNKPTTKCWVEDKR